MTGLRHYVRTKDSTLLPFAALVTPEDFDKAGHWQNVLRLREMIAQNDFEAKCRKTSRGDHEGKRGRTFDRSATADRFRHEVQLGGIARKLSKEDSEFDTLLVRVANEMIFWKFPERKHLPVHARNWATTASFTIGHEDNQNFNAIQLNFSSTSEQPDENGPSDDLVQFGGLHIDGNDSPEGLTMMVNLSNYPVDYFPGRFNITSARLTCTLPAGYALIFTGRHAHFATGSGMYSEELRLNRRHPLRFVSLAGYELEDGPNQLSADNYEKKRACGVVYPSMALARTKIKYFQVPEMIADHTLVALGTLRNLQEWRMRYWMKRKYEELKEKTLFNRNEKYWREEFTWTNEHGEEEIGFGWVDESGVQQWPRTWIAQLACEWMGKSEEDPEWINLQKKYFEFRCGTVFHEKKEDDSSDKPNNGEGEDDDNKRDPNAKEKERPSSVTLSKVGGGTLAPIRGTKDMEIDSEDSEDEYEETPTSTNAKKRRKTSSPIKKGKNNSPTKKGKTAKQLVETASNGESSDTTKKTFKVQKNVKTAAKLNITNPGFEIAFDPKVDTVPGNPAWVPTS